MTGAYGYPEMIARILIEYTDGSTENIISDESWKTAPSPIAFSSLYGGEDYDATLEQPGWNEPGFSDNNWKPVVLAEAHILHSQMTDPVKVMQEFEPVSVKIINHNMRVYDMGQNMSGIPEITVNGNKGDTIRITTAELLKEDGTINQKASGSPSYYQYILKGGEDESWHPRFSYYGFRYVQVEFFPGTKNKNSTTTRILSVKGLHTRNSAATVGSFECSNDLFNKTFSLIKWSINSNMQSILTDCPHRERLGWQEEDHLMGNSIQYNYDIHALAEKILADIHVEQNDNGLIPSTVPEYSVMDFADGYFRDSPEWGSNAVIFPWQLYQWYGDKDAVSKNYTTMQRYVNYLHSRDSSYLLMYGLSDWYDLGPNRPGFSQLTPIGLTATAYYYYDLTILEKIAGLLGKKNDVVSYSQCADSVKHAFNKMFYHTATKQYGTGSQTSNAISLYMGLADEKDKKAIIENIVKDIREHNYSLTSGDIGFHYLLKVLDDAGRSDVIFAMNNRTDVPGYGYQITKGATALTESWQALPTASNNHLMLGYLMEWLYEGLVGIRRGKDVVAYKKIEISPQVVGNITFVKASYHSVYGWIRSEWHKNEKTFDLDIEIPPNTMGEIYLPASASSEIKMNGRKLNKVIFKNDRSIIKTGSGKYHFNVILTK